MKKLIKKSIRRLGYTISKYSEPQENSSDFITANKALSDFQAEDIALIHHVIPYTMTSSERIYALAQAVKYVSKNNIPGDIVECGVWKGGSMMTAAITLNQLQDTARHLYLFDTFEGMTLPSEKDKDFKGDNALPTYENSLQEDNTSSWCYASLEAVKATMQKTGYDSEKIHFIKGKVEDTIPKEAPETISLLRLDTDWYESTRHELIHLFPRLTVGGVLIIDDYGYWQGSRVATDEYIQQNSIRILLNRIDNTGRIGVKL